MFGFVKFQRMAEELLENDPDAYLLMSQIAFRALRKESKYNKHKLKPGQALIGDYKTLGLSERRYRDAKERVEQRYMLATFKGTNKGTVATLLNTEICDINLETKDEQKDEPRTSQGRTKDEPGTTKEEDKKEISKEDKNKDIPPNDSGKPKSSTAMNEIFFNFETEEWENIAADQIVSWQKVYPSLQIQQQLLFMGEWLLSNRSKSPKSLFRAFITRWLTRSQNQASFGAKPFHQAVDRRTKNKDGTPVSSPADGRF